MITKGDTMLIDRSFNLYIDITTACNATCPFCIAESLGRRNHDNYWRGMREALAWTEDIGGSVQIVGGEPTISARLRPTLEEIGRGSFLRVALNTSGTRADHYDLMWRSGIQHLNISRHHYDEHQNQDVMNIRPFLSNAELAENIAMAQEIGMDVRIQAVLLPGYLDDLESILRFTNWCHSLGVSEVSLSQVFPLWQMSYYEPSVQEYTQNHQVDIRRIVADLDSCGDLRSLKGGGRLKAPWGKSYWYRWGDDAEARRRAWEYKGLIVAVKTFFGFDKDGLPKVARYDPRTDPELHPKRLAFAVVHPDGKVTASWNRNERELFDLLSKETVAVEGRVVAVPANA